MASTGFQPLRVEPPSNQARARCSSLLESSISIEVMAVAKALTATPARMRVVVGNVRRTRAIWYTTVTVRMGQCSRKGPAAAQPTYGPACNSQHCPPAGAPKRCP